MEKQRKIKIIGIIALVLGVLGLTIAFAALSKTLKINGSGNIDRANWDIHFKNVTFVSKSETAFTSGTPTPTNNEKGPTIEGLNVTLKQPNDYVTYTADIKNEGDIDASIDVVTPPNLTDRENELFTFEAEYTDVQDKGSKLIEHGDMLRAGETKNITITFRYNDISDASKLPSSPETIELTYSILYVQAFESTATTSEALGKTYTKGEEFCLNGDKECFYTLSDNGETVTALAKYNLLAGNKMQFNMETFQPVITPVDTTDPEYGIQSSKTQADMENYTFNGVVTFSENGYWNSYPAFVFDSNSNLWTPVQNYQSYLKNTLGKTSVSATLLSYEQAIENGCDYENHTCPDYISRTNFWLGSADGNDSVLSFSLDNLFENIPIENFLGIRPVITINKSEI